MPYGAAWQQYIGSSLTHLVLSVLLPPLHMTFSDWEPFDKQSWRAQGVEAAACSVVDFK